MKTLYFSQVEHFFHWIFMDKMSSSAIFGDILTKQYATHLL